MLVGPQVEEVRVVEERSFNLSCRVSVPASIDSKVSIVCKYQIYELKRVCKMHRFQLGIRV